MSTEGVRRVRLCGVFRSDCTLHNFRRCSGLRQVLRFPKIGYADLRQRANLPRIDNHLPQGVEIECVSLQGIFEVRRPWSDPSNFFQTDRRAKTTKSFLRVQRNYFASIQKSLSIQHPSCYYQRATLVPGAIGRKGFETSLLLQQQHEVKIGEDQEDQGPFSSSHRS